MQDPRDMVITTSSGTDVKSTQMLKGEAKSTPAESETNSLKEFKPSSCPRGAGKDGGENQH